MSALRTRGLVGASMIVVMLGATAACGSEDSSAPAAPQPSLTPSTSPTTPPTTELNPHGTPSMDCPETITAVRAAVEKAVWGKGADKSAFQPVGVTICQYDALATGMDYATVTTKRIGTEATELFALVNSAKVVPVEPKICTQELGPTYVMRFVDNDRGVLTYTAEAYACRRLVATSFEGQGKPGELPAPRQVTPELIRSLGRR
ncbi:MAG TPA: hypothetical protein VFT31_00790 [Kribbella sp.]|nr:hypothetical protein [Kribbella sp.]